MKKHLIERGGRTLPSLSEQENATQFLLWITSIPNSGIKGVETSGSVGGAGASTFARVLLETLHLENTQLIKVGPIIREQMASMSNLLDQTSYTADTLPDKVVAELRKRLKSSFDQSIDTAVLQTAIERMITHPSGISLMEGKVVGIARETFDIKIPTHTIELRIGLYATPFVSAKRTQERFKKQSNTHISLAEAQSIRRVRFEHDQQANYDAYAFTYTEQHMRNIVDCIIDSTHAKPEELMIAFESWMIETCPALYRAMFA